MYELHTTKLKVDNSWLTKINLHIGQDKKLSSMEEMQFAWAEIVGVLFI